MNDPDFSHLVEVDEGKGQLNIHRVFPDGRKQFFTRVNFPARGDNSAYKDFVYALGENILVDLPAARRLLKSD